MADLIEVTVDSLRVSLTNQQRIVVLKAVDQERYLPIWIGPFEAEAITIALQEIEVARPQTHDLIKIIFQLLGAKLQKVIISELKDDIFFSTLVAETGKKSLEIDARPSDAIALALRAHVPILVTQKIMDEAAIEPEEENEESQAEADITDENSVKKAQEKAAKKKAKLDERLSVFEDYLAKRGKNRPSNSDDQEKKNDEGDLPRSGKKKPPDK